MLDIFGYIASIAIGLSLGLIGGGGSILTIPILVYLFGVAPKSATTYSLFVVGMSSAIGAYRHYGLGNLKLKPAFQFAIPSLITILFVRKWIVPNLPQDLFSVGKLVVTKDIFIMCLFALLMLMASFSMIKKSKEEESNGSISPLKIGLIGALVGIVTGFLGAGGGFLIIPSLLFFTGINMKQAVGTSLLIISINSLIGFSGDMLMGLDINYVLLFSVSAFALLGIIIGTYLSKKVNGQQLKPAFGWFVFVMGIYIILKELFLK